MATLRQYVSLVIFVTVLFSTIILNCLSPDGRWTAASDSLSQDDPKADELIRKIQGGLSQARDRQPPAEPAPLLDACQSGKAAFGLTPEDLGLADMKPPNVTQKRRKPEEIPSKESKIASLLKSRNSCQRSNKRGTGLACLPYYYLAGFPKCGSTDLFLRLTAHPDIIRDRHNRKELHWVSRSRFHFPGGRTDAVDMYKQRFANELLYKKTSAKNMSRLIIGDNSASTIWDNSHWRQIPANANCSQPWVLTADVVRHLNPQARVIVILRNPVDRLYSEHLFFNPNSTKEIFHHQAVKVVKEATECFQRTGIRRCVYAILSDLKPRLHVGLYSVYIDDWLRRFPRDQLHVIRLEDMAANRKEVLQKAFAFLGVEEPDEARMEMMVRRPVSRVGSQARQLGPMLTETRLLLDRFYRPFNLRLARLLRDSVYEWSDRGAT